MCAYICAYLHTTVYVCVYIYSMSTLPPKTGSKELLRSLLFNLNTGMQVSALAFRTSITIRIGVSTSISISTTTIQVLVLVLVLVIVLVLVHVFVRGVFFCIVALECFSH